MTPINNFKFFFIVLYFLCLSNVFSNSQELNNQELSKIYKNIRCIVCQGQTIDESNSDFAENIKTVIKDKLNKGVSEEEIYSYLKSKYGEWIILKPSFNLKSLFLWFFPYLVFFIGGIYVFLYIKKRNYR